MTFAFSMLGSRNSIVVYEAKKIELRNTLFSISILGGIVGSIVLWIMFQRLDIIVLTFGMVFAELSIGYFLGRKLFTKYAIFIILQKILMITISIGFYLISGIEGIIYGIGISYMPYIIIIFKCLKESKFDLILLKKHSGFVINNYTYLIMGNIRSNLDKILIAPLIGFGVLGNYSLAFQIYLILMVFTNIIFKYTLTHDAEGFISKKFMTTVILISVIFSLIGSFLVPTIIPYFFSNFINSIDAIQILSFAVIPNTISLLYSSKFLGNEKSRYVLSGTIMSSILYLVLIYFIGLSLQLIGISISYLISSIVYTIFLIILHKKYLNNNFEKI